MFTEPREVWIEKGKIVKINLISDRAKATQAKPLIAKPGSPGETVQYVLPGFCDAGVTLGVNAWGGPATPDSLKISLQSLAIHGFTNVQTLGDGKWTAEALKNLQNGKYKGAWIHPADPPILPTGNISVNNSTYQMVGSNAELESVLERSQNKKIHFYHRYTGKYIPDLRFLYSLRSKYKENDSWILHTFGEPQASREALAAGWKILFHPIHAEVPRYQLEEVVWAPMYSVYYSQTLMQPEKWAAEVEKYKSQSPFFTLSYSEVSKNLPQSFQRSELEINEINKQWELYTKEFRDRNFLRTRLLFASGTGYPLVYPGVGGWKEIQIWERIFGEWDNSISNSESSKSKRSGQKEPGFWESLISGWKFGKVEPEEIAKPIPEPKKKRGFPLEILDSLTRRTCGFIGAGHRGEILVGNEANLILYDTNPLDSPDSLFQISSVYVRGVRINGEKK
jgi:hypothetical protein